MAIDPNTIINAIVDKMMLQHIVMLITIASCLIVAVVAIGTKK